MIAKNALFLTITLCGVAYLVYQVQPSRFPDVINDLSPAERDDCNEVAAGVDAAFEFKWNSDGLTTAKPADDLLIARRLSLGLTGTIPSLEEIRNLELVEETQRIDWWISYLLNDKRSHDYLAERFARSFVGTENGPFIIYRRRRFVAWLSDQLSENVSYDQLVKQLVTDTGLWTDHPAVNFYTVTVNNNESGHPDPVRLAARTSRAFLGLRIDCLQCHDDALGTLELGSEDNKRTGLQSDFHQIAAAFSSVRQTAAGLQETTDEVEYEFQYLNKKQKKTVPFKVPFQEELLPESGSRRERLANWITHPENLAFSRAAVNRVWAILAGKPLIDPVDDIPLYGNRPPGMDLLARDFAENGFNLRRLIRIIAKTRAYQMLPVAEFEITPEHQRSWAVFPRTALRPEQVVGSIIQSSSLKTIDDDSNVFEKLRTYGDINNFIDRYGDRGEAEFDDRSETIQQRSILMNGKIVSERTTANGMLLNAPAQISAFAESDSTAIETLFLVTLSRRPTQVEAKYLQNYFAEEMRRSPVSQIPENSGEKRRAIRNRRARIIEDIMWMLINKDEFTTNH